MELLRAVAASILRRVITGAAISALAVLVAKGFLSVDLREQVMRWLSGGATEYIVTSLLAGGGVLLTYFDKKKTKLLKEFKEKCESLEL